MAVHSLLADLVIDATLLWIRQDLISVADLRELLENRLVVRVGGTGISTIKEHTS